jgi:hypothetical protein
MDLRDAAQTLAPGLPAGPAAGIVTSFVLLQGVHYAVWLGWIPQESVRAEGTLTFRMTVRGWWRDFGAVGLAGIALAWAVVVLGALVDARGARDAYLSVAAFHGYLELAMLAWLLARGGERGLTKEGADGPTPERGWSSRLRAPG